MRPWPTRAPTPTRRARPRRGLSKIIAGMVPTIRRRHPTRKVARASRERRASHIPRQYDVDWRKNAGGSRRAGPNCPLSRVLIAPRKALTMCVEEVGSSGVVPVGADAHRPRRALLPPVFPPPARGRRCLRLTRPMDVSNALEWLDHVEAAADLKRLAREALDTSRRLGLAYLALDEPGYPGLLSSIADPPSGCGSADGFPSVRASRSSARARPRRRRWRWRSGLAGSLAATGLRIVSGLARGCDGARTGAPSTAVARPSRCWDAAPDHDLSSRARALADAVAAHGAVISEFPPGTPPLPIHFPLRNRIICGLARAVIVVEAGEKSGSLITAACALEQGREVMVVPGPVLSGAQPGRPCAAARWRHAGRVRRGRAARCSGASPWLEPSGGGHRQPAGSDDEDPSWRRSTPTSRATSTTRRPHRACAERFAACG